MAGIGDSITPALPSPLVYSLESIDNSNDVAWTTSAANLSLVYPIRLLMVIVAKYEHVVPGMFSDSPGRRTAETITVLTPEISLNARKLTFDAKIN